MMSCTIDEAVRRLMAVGGSFDHIGGVDNFCWPNIGFDEKKNPDIIKSMTALKTLFLRNSLEATEMIEKPYVLKHKFRDVIGKLGITVFKLAGLSGKNETEIIQLKIYHKIFTSLGHCFTSV